MQMIDRLVRPPVDGSPPIAGLRSAVAVERGFSVAFAALLALMLLIAGGCASTEEAGDSSGASSAAPSSESPDTLADAAKFVRDHYLVNPETARELGYRIDWQFPSSGRPLKHVVVSDDSVYTLDERNFLSRIRTEEGARVWRVPVASEVEEVLGVTPVPGVDRVYVTTGAAVLVLEIETGSLIDRQKLSKIANTAPVVSGPFFIYGSRSGELVWHSYLLGSYWRGYQIAPSISVAPVIDDGYVVTVGNDGRIMSLIADSASQVWNYRALEPIVARPAIGDGAVFVAGLDQYVRAYELAEVRTPIWEYLTESELTESPVLIGGRLYQQIPSEGLVCFEALPINEPGGVVVWRAEGVGGSVVTSLDDRLIAWDGNAHRLEIIDDRLGSLIEGLEMPDVEAIRSVDVNRGDVYVIGADGRLLRLVPRS
jgi:outer membrane protein assembly factor BamB